MLVFLMHDYKYNIYIKVCKYNKKVDLTTRGFEPLPFQNSALNYRLRPLGHIVRVIILPKYWLLILTTFKIVMY